MMFSTNSRFATSSRSARPAQAICERSPALMCVRRPVMMLSRVDMPLKRAMFWNVRAIPWWAIW